LLQEREGFRRSFWPSIKRRKKFKCRKAVGTETKRELESGTRLLGEKNFGGKVEGRETFRSGKPL